MVGKIKKFFRKFETLAEYEQYVSDVDNFILPNVSLCKENETLYYNKYTTSIDYSKEYFTIEALEDGLNVKLSQNASQYRIDGGNWMSLSANTATPSINSGQTIQFRITNPTISLSYPSYGIGKFTINKKCNVSGNIMSLLYGDDFVEQTDLSGKNYAFYNLFQNCTTLQSAENLILLATTLAYYCYNYMFSNCTSLTIAPELPATTLVSGCYASMFSGCKKLTEAPELPATDLAYHCYEGMFYGCTSLTKAPELLATTLAEGCYGIMFYNCTNLTEAPELPATTLAKGCYDGMFYGTNVLPDCSNIDFTNESVVASGGLQGLFRGTKVTDADLERILPKNNEGKYCLPVTKLAYRCYASMFSNCTSLTTAPQLPATTLAEWCYDYMFNGCTSLTTAPELSSTTLASDCYRNMFNGCTSLKTAPTLPAIKLKSFCYYSMLNGCTSLTTAPELPATTLADSCYSNMFNGCASLVTAPELPATTLARYCYSNMFYGCSKLNYIKMLATDISASSCLTNWVSGVASEGTFVKHLAMTSLPSGVNGIPNGWTVENG